MPLDFSAAWERLEALRHGFVAGLPDLIIAVVIFLLVALIALAIKALVIRMTQRRRRHRNLGLVLGRLSQAGVLLVGLLVALAIMLPTFSPGDMIQLLGIGSVAIGFAFRDILQNFLAGILLLLTEPFRIGDQIVVGTYEGTVEEVQSRATLLKTYDGRRVVIPNAILFTDSVIVNTAYDRVRLEADIGLGYGEEIPAAKRLILATMAGLPEVLDEPAPEVLVVGLADSSVTLRVRWWTMPPRRADLFAARDQVIAAIKATLLAHDVDLPFPTMQILLPNRRDSRGVSPPAP